MIKTASLYLISLGTLLNPAQPSYHILKKHFVGGPARWDYITVDYEMNRLYVSNSSRVVVLNKTTGDTLDEIDNTPGVHGIALATAFKKGFTSNGQGNSVSIFNLATNKIIKEVKTGANPDAIFYDEDSEKIFVFNGKSMDATVIDPSNDEVIATIPLGGKPETGVSDGNGHVFVNIEDTNEVLQLSSVTLKVEKRWQLGEGEEPTGLSIDQVSHRLFVACGNKLIIVLDAANGKIISKIPIGNGCDGLAFDPARKLVFASNGEDGTMTVVREINANKFAVIQTLTTEKGARTIAIDPENHHVFLPAAQGGSFHVLEIGE